MAFDTFETSPDRGAPIELYLFRYGTAPNAFAAYTTWTEPVSAQGVQYVPVPVTRGAIKSDGTGDTKELTVSLPRDTLIAEQFAAYSPSFPVQLEIRQGHVGDDEFFVVWTGRIVASSREGSETKLTAEPLSKALDAAGLQQHYQYGCRHVLYGPVCRADPNAARTVRPAVSVSGAAVTLPPGWNGAYARSKYVGGHVEWTGTNGTERRTIIAATSQDELRLSGLTRDLSAGSQIAVYLGCNHTLEDCQNLFSNVPNFGGCPWIPTETPFGKNPYN